MPPDPCSCCGLIARLAMALITCLYTYGQRDMLGAINALLVVAPCCLESDLFPQPKVTPVLSREAEEKLRRLEQEHAKMAAVHSLTEVGV